MISELLDKIFKPKAAPPPVQPFTADQANASEIDRCPKCDSTEIEKTVWRLPGYQSHTPMGRAAKRYGLNSKVEYKCPCGFTHSGPLFKN